MIKTNKYQTQLTDELLASLAEEERDNLLDFVNNVQFIKNLISPDRKYAKDLPRKNSKIIVDLINPHILEDMEYFRPTGNYYKENGVLTNLRPDKNPNSDFSIWLKQEIDRIWYGMVRESDGEWITGQMYFYLNYCQIILSKIREGTLIADRLEDFPEIWEGSYLWFHYLDQARSGGLYDDFMGGKHCVQIAKRGAGKAHPYSEDVLTPSGWKKWGDVFVGESLYGDDGVITKVIDIPFDDISDIYKITLKDGRVVQSSLNHLWKVCFRGKDVVLPLEEIIKNYKQKRKSTERNPDGIEYVYKIPINKSIDFVETPTKVDPYTFGLLLGDDCFRRKESKDVIYLSSGYDDAEVYEKIIPYKMYKIKPRFEYGICIKDFRSILESYKLFFKKSEDKFIPEEYKINSKEVRLNLLKGLMDSDGTVDNRGIPSISLSSKKMIDDLVFICRSLGYGCKVTTKSTGYRKDGIYIKCLTAYKLRIYTDDNLFNLKRKSDKIIKRASLYSRSKIDKTTIVNIEYSHKEQSKCVTVDNKSHCYLINDFIVTHNSWVSASLLARLFVCGDNSISYKKTRGVVTAYEKESLIKDGTLNKFISIIDFCANNTQFPFQRLKDSLAEMSWKMGFKDADTGVNRGSENETLGVTAKDNVNKSRGKRAQLFIYEEFGAFKKFIDTWKVNLPAVQEGSIIFGQAVAIGTGGAEGNSFSGALEIIYNPLGYNVYALPNVFDRNSQGKQRSVFFFGAYLNRKGQYNKDGVSDVTSSLIEIIKNRVLLKYNSTDPMSLTRTIAEDPITIQEAIMKRDSTIYPVADLNDVLNEIDVNPKSLSDILTGSLSIINGEVKYKPDYDARPIRDFPHKDNKLEGCVEIHALPVKDRNGKIPWGRYIGGQDTFDDDSSQTLSLGSLFILDLWTDRIVCEYTGRPMFADDFYENCRRIMLLYNAETNYENNKKGLFKYFSQTNCLYLLSDTLEFLKDKDMVKGQLYGNKQKGTCSTAPVKSYGRTCIRNWLLDPITTEKQREDGTTYEETVPRLKFLRSRALIKELTLWNPDGNYDRHDAVLNLMLLREDKLRLNQGKVEPKEVRDYMGNDDFFKRDPFSQKAKPKFSLE